jgi:hypothetical protein
MILLSSRALSNGLHPIFKDWVENGLLVRFHHPLVGANYKIQARLWDLLFFFRGVYEHILDSEGIWKSVFCHFSIEQQLRPLLGLWDLGLSQKDQVQVFKYWTVYPMWKWISRGGNSSLNDPPKNPFPGKITGVMFTGKLKQLIKNKMCSRSKRSSAFCWSFFQGVKRAAAVVPDNFFIEAMVDHAVALTTPPPALDREIEGGIRELANRIAGLINLRLDWSPAQISGSATLNSKREEGGGLSELLMAHSEESLRNTDKGLKSLMSNVDMKTLLREYRLAPGPPQAGSGIVWSDLGHDDPATSLRLPIDIMRDIPVVSTPLPTVPGLKLPDNRMKVIPLAEPLKVRIITKASGPITHLGRILQRPLRKGLFDKLPCFLPTGRPLQPDDFLDLFARTRDFLSACKYINKDLTFTSADLVIVSGDYKAATDGLNIHVTMALYNGLVERLSTVDKSFTDALDTAFRANLQGIVLLYPKLMKRAFDGLVPETAGLKEKVDLLKARLGEITDEVSGSTWSQEFPMLNGQLMGSILSFPLLCLANLYGYIRTVSKVLGVPESQAMVLVAQWNPLLINGDDILFRVPRSWVPEWRNVIKDLGFTLSPGKNYVHPTHFTINSRLYHLSTQTQKITGTRLTSIQVEEIPYFNLGLLLPRDGLPPTEQKALRDLWNDMTPGSQYPARLLRRFVHYHKIRVVNSTRGGKFNAFLPTELGGLGWNFLKEVSILKAVRITGFQRIIATNLYNRHKQLSLLPYNHFFVGERDINRVLPATTYGDDLSPQRHFKPSRSSGRFRVLDTRYPVPTTYLVADPSSDPELLNAAHRIPEERSVRVNTLTARQAKELSREYIGSRRRDEQLLEPPFIRVKIESLPRFALQKEEAENEGEPSMDDAKPYGVMIDNLPKTVGSARTFQTMEV